ncbi:ATP-binding cassette sub-family C member 4-like isoform X1 [Diorhabda carinulata]|uniref:ATP-binding cassette sub-family C member 4-like isoform X1 n=1 Tax=Diorhabda carinulata TaxID=1163345 RepID=UPI0025A1E1E4|nr:ATP-binding cassette sub-family C member 4-like isoform X1 [Diorhabda carinulata]
MDCLKSKMRQRNPRESANIFSLITFWYTLHLVKKGRKKDFEEKDLYEVVKRCDSKYCGDKFEKIWNEEIKKTKCPSLFKTLCKVYGYRYLFWGVTQLVFELIKRLMEPSAIANLVSYFQPGQTKHTKYDAYISITILLCSNFAQSIYFYNFDLFLTLLSVEARTSICSVLFRKVIKLSPAALSKANMGNVVTLITKDVQEFKRNMFIFNDVWVFGTVSIVVCYILYSRIGPISLIATGIYIIVIPLEALLGKLVNKLRKDTCQKTDERIRLTQEILSATKIVKIHCWEDFFYKKINYLRKKEIAKMLLIFYIRMILLFIGTIASKAGLYVLIMAYIWMDQTPDASIVFFITAHFETLALSFGYLVPVYIGKYSQFTAALSRINQALTAEEIQKKTEPIESITKPLIDLKNVTVNINSIDVLSKINFKTYFGLTIITGRVGSGKTTLLKTIMQEYELANGEVICNGTISYASQDPWCFPSTIKQNILFGEVYNKKRYQDVLRICALEYDLNLFEKGDETIVTDKGQNLSKGQQARINLARAIYKKSDIYLLDDCLSALDPHVHHFIFVECIKKFLKGKLCILITQMNSNSHEADKVFVMNKGRIIYSNNPKQKIVREDTGSKEVELKKRDDLGSVESNEFIETKQTISKDIYEEELKKGAVDKTVYRKYIAFGGGILLLMIVLFFVAFQQAAESYSQKLISIWSDEKQSIFNIKANITKENFNKSIESELEIAEAQASSTFKTYTIMLVTAVFIQVIKTYTFLNFCRRASIKIHKVMIRNVIYAVMSFFDTHFIGNILNRFSQDIINVDENLPYQLLAFLETIIYVGATVFLIVSVNSYFIIYVLITFAVLVSSLKFYLPVARNLQRLEASTRSPMIGCLNAALEGLTTIRAQKAEQTVIQEFEKHQNVFTSAHYSNLCFQFAFGFFTSILAFIMVLVVVYTFVMFDTGTSAGSIGLALTQVLYLGSIVQESVKSWADLENLMTATERVLEYTELKTETNQGIKKKQWPNDGIIVYEKVSLSYVNNRVILNDLNFKIDRKQKIGIVGRTGAGKSSIISTIFRLYEVEGTIRIDGIDIKTLSLEYLRKNLALVPQDPVLFSGTVRSNLDPIGVHQDEDIWMAVNKVNLNGLITSLDSEIQNPCSFSLGQKQMIWLAKAILSKAKIVILDEVTANIDYETDLFIQDSIKNNFSDCTVLIIAHKLQSILNCDYVMVLDRGKIKEFDKPRILLENNVSIFSQMVQKDNI